jgi:tetratricopeptide (TPR) repeat protein
MASGRMEEARGYYQRLLIIMEKLGDVWGSAGGYSKLGELALANGDLPRALDLHRRSLLMYQKMGDQRRSAIALREVAETSALLGQDEAAKAYFHQALEIAARLRSTSLAQNILTGLAAVTLRGQREALTEQLLALALAEPVADKLTANRAAGLLESLRGQPSVAALEVQDAQDARSVKRNGSLWETIDGFLRDGVKF